MAANLAGMFGQLQSALGANPIASLGTDMLGHATQGAANVIAPKIGANPMEMMSQRGKEMEAQQQLTQVDYQNPESMQAAAQKLLAAGKMQEAERLMSRADAVRAKQAAALQAAGESATIEAARKREMAKKRQASAMARMDGNPDIASGIQAGNISPEAYMQTKMDEKKLYELSRGEMLTDKDGNVIRLNPYGSEGGRYDHSVAEFKDWSTLTTSANESANYGDKVNALADQIEALPEWDAGAEASVEGYLLSLLGKRDDPQYLRTQVNQVRNHEGIAMLPKGPASDKDIELVMKGVPPENAGREEVLGFLRAQSRVAKRLAEFDKMKAEYVITGRAAEFQANWDAHAQRLGRQERIDATPAAAVEYLRKNPQLRDAFLAEYGWAPDV